MTSDPKMDNPLRSSFTILGQIIFVWASLFTASFLSESFLIVPAALKKQTPLGFDQLLTISLIFSVWHLIFYVASRFALRQPLFSSSRRVCTELIWALCATSLASSSIFLLTDLPFSANFYAWVYVIQAAVYLLVAIGLAIVSSDETFVKGATSSLLLIAKPAVWLAFIIILLPGFLALYYKADRDFANAVNFARASLSGAGNTSFVLQGVTPGIDQPMGATFSPGTADELIWLSRPGVLYKSNLDPWSSEVLVDFQNEVGSTEGEMGALSFALHPNFGKDNSPNSGFVYLWYTHWNAGEQRNRLVAYDITLPTQAARENSETVLLDYPRSNSQMHNGGSLVFGPDGFLYLSIGDSVDTDLTQQLDNQLISGIIRIDVDKQGGDISAPIQRRGEGATAQNYYIPKDNPWFDHPTALQEFWAIGFRNPFRMSIDSATGDVWVGDVGWDRFEEVNRVQAGDNGQWPYREALATTRYERPENVAGNEIEPFYHYAQSALKRAVLGGIVYRGSKHPALNGKYVFADNNAGLLMILDPEQQAPEEKVIARADQFAQYGLTSILTNDAGDIFLTILGSKDEPTGDLVKLVPEDEAAHADPQPSTITSAEDEADANYLSFCSRCHGEDGKGNPDLDAQLVKRPDFTSSEWQSSVDDQHLFKVIELGGSAQGLSEQMPGWGSVFSEQEIHGLVEKVRSFEQQ